MVRRTKKKSVKKPNACFTAMLFDSMVRTRHGKSSPMKLPVMINMNTNIAAILMAVWSTGNVVTGYMVII
jgi:hypothetical protein